MSQPPFRPSHSATPSTHQPPAPPPPPPRPPLDTRPRSIQYDAPPPPPPKPVAAFSPTPTSRQGPPPLPPPPQSSSSSSVPPPPSDHPGTSSAQPPPPALEDGWLPDILRDKSKAELSAVLSSPPILHALVHAPGTAHPSLGASQAPIRDLLAANLAVSAEVARLSGGLRALRAQLAPQLLRLHSLELAFRNRQSLMDAALAPWSPKAVHQRLVAGVGEQEAWCSALEESFLEGEGKAGEREVTEWSRRYRDGAKVGALRAERRARFEEGRVGGWR